MKKIIFLLAILPFFASLSQTDFSFEDYQNFIESNSNLTAGQLLQMNSAGEFKSSITSDWTNALYSDSIEIKCNLTEDEKSLIQKNGFVVTERLGQYSFMNSVADIYQKDLPVFVTTDMILHAFHRSYDTILMDVELTFLIPKLEDFLNNLASEIPNIDANYSSDYMKDRLKDVDYFLTVPRKLLDETSTPYYSENIERVDSIITFIENEEFKNIPFLSILPRKIDFSQFKPRGHYDDESNPMLAKYFKAMIWLGKIELYLIAPEALIKPKPETVQRQAIISNLISELLISGNLSQNYNEIENVIEAFVGEQDNVTFSNIENLKNILGFNNSSALVDTNYFTTYQDTLAKQSFAPQKILSQVLIHNPASEDEIKPASAFLIFGQRFVIDSYITGSVVYDKVKKKRMLPSTLDILFGLGNDAAAQLLVEEINQYEYAPNLIGVRYLVDAYDDDFWNSTIYNGWLNSIRKLNPPLDRTIYPEFMQSAAWWQQKMNTQLGSWTELRHDNLLYAKQSYTGGATCSYPYSYVEPFPEFFAAMKDIATNFSAKLNELNLFDESLDRYLTRLYETNDTLESIASKELIGVELSQSEILFLKSMLVEVRLGCVVEYNGWYPNLFYGGYNYDLLVADYHTTPTDAGGNMVGWVKHAGTGMIDLTIMNTLLPDGRNVAFVGPVYSYHEYTTTNFFRITDNEWQNEYFSRSTRPEWTKIYLADKEGNKQEGSLSLLTYVEESGNSSILPETHIVAQNYPNPFNPSTVIQFSIPSKLSNNKISLNIFDIKGELVKTLINEQLQSGNYLIEWNGTNSKNGKVTSGIYFYEIKTRDQRYIGKMNLIK